MPELPDILTAFAGAAVTNVRTITHADALALITADSAVIVDVRSAG